MARTFVRQDTQIRKSDVYDDTIAPTEANFETNPVSIEDDLNSVRSMLSELRDVRAGDWFDALTAPTTLETGAARGVQDVNDALHLVEKKRVLRCVWNLHTISPGASVQGVILGASELPANTTIAVGAVTTLGTVAKDATTFGTFSAADVVAGLTAISPHNLVQIVDSATRDPILDAGAQIYGLLQSENATDPHTATALTPNRLQISFVKIVSGALTLITAGAMDGTTFDYCGVERVRLEDLNEGDFLGGANVDVPAGSTVTRQVAYDNQGATPVDLTTNATLDLEGAGLVWAIRDDLEAVLLRVIEGSAGGTSEVEIAAGVDVFDVDAILNDFAQGISAATSKTRPIDIGVNDGLVETTAGDLEAKAAAELILNDGNLVAEGTWAGPGVKLTETSAEAVAYEAAFGGEVSLFDAIVQAYNNSARVAKTYANVTVTTVADTDVGGSGGGANLDAQLPDLSLGTFLTDYDVFLNGELLRPGADASANNDYYPGTSLALGQLKFEFPVVINDVLAVIAYA